KVSCHVKPPRDCSASELEDFVSFVLAGGEVTPAGLSARVNRARWLAFLQSDNCLIGVAGLKRPSAAHRAEVEEGAGVALQACQFPLELGWVFVLPSARGGKSRALCTPLLEKAAEIGVFATSRSKNGAMHTTLERLGF